MLQMRSLTCLLALLIFVLPACGGDTHEKVSGDMVDLMSDAADILEGVTDLDSAEAAAPKLEKLGKEAEELGQRAEALGDPDAETEKAIKAKYDPEMQAISKRIAATMMRLSDQPEVLEAVGEAMSEIK